MFRLGAELKVYLHREPIDFRAGINSLAVLVQETMALDPFAPAVFAFCNTKSIEHRHCKGGGFESAARRTRRCTNPHKNKID